MRISDGAAPRLAQGLDLFAEEAVEFGVGVAGEQPLRGRELHGVRKRVVEFFEDGRGFHLAPGKLPVEFGGQAQQEFLVRRRVQAPQARKVGGLLEPALAHAPRRGPLCGPSSE